MDLKQLQAMGAFIPQGVVEKEITYKRPLLKPRSEWADKKTPEFVEGQMVEEKTIIFVKRGTSADNIEIIRAPDHEKPFIAVYRCVVNEDGTPLFESLDQTRTLEFWLLMPMFDAVNEVAGGREKKTSGRRTGSGATSRSRSVEELSESGSTP